MVVAHFFTRKVKGRTYLMAEASVSGDSTSPWTEPTVIRETAADETAADWLYAAREAAAKAHPDHNVGDVVLPKGRTGRFDIVLKKPAARRSASQLIRSLLK